MPQEKNQNQNGCIVVIIFIVISFFYVIYTDNQKQEVTVTNYETQRNNKRNFMQSLRNANPGREGFVILQDLGNLTFKTLNKTDGLFTIYNLETDCISEKYEYTRRYDLNSWEYSCELL